MGIRGRCAQHIAPNRSYPAKSWIHPEGGHAMKQQDRSSAGDPIVPNLQRQLDDLTEIIDRAVAVHTRAEHIIRTCADDNRDTCGWMARAGRDTAITYLLCGRALNRLHLDAELAGIRDEAAELVRHHLRVMDEMLDLRFGIALRHRDCDPAIVKHGFGPPARRLRELVGLLAGRRDTEIRS
jgi:hypothetical protein